MTVKIQGGGRYLQEKDLGKTEKKGKKDIETENKFIG